MRISTSQVWSNALNNLMTAQQRQNDASNQVSTQKVATDLEGYGRSSEIIASLQTVIAKTNSFVGVNKTVSDRLSSQDLALSTTGDAATGAKDSILSSLAAGDGSSLMQAIQGNFASALDGLNYQHNGQYLFGGGNDDTPPVSVNSLSQLAGLTSVASGFSNGTVKKSSRIDANTTIQTGMLASDLGQKLMQTFQDIQKYNDDPTTGPFGNPLADAQKTFLQQKSAEFTSEYNDLLKQSSLNGTLQNRVDNTTTSLQGQATSLNTMVGAKTNADMATAYTNLQQAQVAVQASAKIVANLNQNSLLNILK